eukprot:GHVN01032649.1.p1 GENE.GHVN01032649.1~~GHVN01032649.1.p1  ORF type:complete len:241 (-),score=22.91 GHVN01032649.1:557-1279(-)
MKGPRSRADQYRPVGVCAFFALIIERHVFDHFMQYFESNNLLNPHQHGNRCGVSTLTKLLIPPARALKNRDLRVSQMLIYLDFTKAFDIIPHGRLLYKLRMLGVGGSALLWVANWLTDRKQRVKLNQVHSDWYDVTSSVCQGTVLGPLLFVVYVCDLCDDVQSLALQFVDNLKLLHVLRDVDDKEIVQSDLDCITHWCERWLMKLNPNESWVLQIPKDTTSQVELRVNGTRFVASIGCAI